MRFFIGAVLATSVELGEYLYGYIVIDGQIFYSAHLFRDFFVMTISVAVDAVQMVDDPEVGFFGLRQSSSDLVYMPIRAVYIDRQSAQFCHRLYVVVPSLALK